MPDTTLLIGKIDAKQLQAYSWYDKSYNEYQPDVAVVDQLQAYAPDIKVIVVMGTWCGDSKEHVPAFLKIAKEAHIPESQIELIATNRKKQCTMPDISSMNIEYVPTFFVFYKHVLAGKIVETPAKTIEQDMLMLIQQQSQ